jgi:hypothetical protein
VTTVDTKLLTRIETILQADFLGRAQTLSIEEAEQRLVRSLSKRQQALTNPDRDAQVNAYWKDMGCRSVAYDAAGLTATMVRMYADCEYEIVEAHMRLMRSMILNARELDVAPLRSVLAELLVRDLSDAGTA